MEFLVASILGLIVILAVGASYTATARLDQKSEERLSVQQDVRSATTMIMRDAHMAGGFGCANLSNLAYGKNLNIVDDSSIKDDYILLPNATTPGYGVRTTTDIPTGGLVGLDGNALLFQYGAGSATLKSLSASGGKFSGAEFQAETLAQKGLRKTAEGGGYFALASCSRVDVLTGTGTDTITAGVDLPIGVQNSAEDAKQNYHTANNLELMRYVANIYAVGTYQGQKGLYRIALGANGAWSTPQLLSPYVTKMTVRFGASAVAKCNDDAPANGEKFNFTDAVVDGSPPSLLWLELEVVGANKEDGTARKSTYQTTATIRGGNICASRSLQVATS